MNILNFFQISSIEDLIEKIIFIAIVIIGSTLISFTIKRRFKKSFIYEWNVNILQSISYTELITCVLIEEALIFTIAFITYLIIKNTFYSFLIAYITHGLLHLRNIQVVEKITTIKATLMLTSLRTLFFVYLVCFLNWTPFEAYLVFAILHIVTDVIQYRIYKSEHR